MLGHTQRTMESCSHHFQGQSLNLSIYLCNKINSINQHDLYLFLHRKKKLK